MLSKMQPKNIALKTGCFSRKSVQELVADFLIFHNFTIITRARCGKFSFGFERGNNLVCGISHLIFVIENIIFIGLLHNN